MIHLLAFLPFLYLFPNLEKLIEGLKSPDTSLLLPDLLPMTDPFGSTSDAVIGKIPVCFFSHACYICVCLWGVALAWGSGGEQKCPQASVALVHGLKPTGSAVNPASVSPNGASFSVFHVYNL